MSDHKLAFIFFEIGMILCVVAMILGPIGIEVWSVACSAVAIFLACAGIYLAFCSWDSAPEQKKKILRGDGTEAKSVAAMEGSGIPEEEISEEKSNLVPGETFSFRPSGIDGEGKES